MKPDFIGIGFAKSGTSWVFKQLSSHPEVFMPEVKELRYLLEPWHIPESSWRNRLISKHWHYVRYRKMLWSRIKRWLNNPSSFKGDRWYRKYLLGTHNFQWYTSLFDAERISGEITPGYVYLSEERIMALKNQLPDLKIIIMLRDPVERTWSHIKMNLAKHASREVKDLSRRQIEARMQAILDITPHYSECIELWKRHFDNVFIGFQGDVIYRPTEFLDSLQSFLGIERIIPESSKLSSRVNQGVTGDIPDYIKSFLRTYYREDNKLLYDMLGVEYIRTWT